MEGGGREAQKKLELKVKVVKMKDTYNPCRITHVPNDAWSHTF